MSKLHEKKYRSWYCDELLEVLDDDLAQSLGEFGDNWKYLSNVQIIRELQTLRFFIQEKIEWREQVLKYNLGT